METVVVRCPRLQGADFYTDHFLVLGSIRLKLKIWLVRVGDNANYLANLANLGKSSCLQIYGQFANGLSGSKRLGQIYIDVGYDPLNIFQFRASFI